MPAYSNAPPGISPEMWAQISGNYNQAEATDPTFASRMQQRSDETNALRAAQTGSMGMLQSGPMSSGVSDPSQAFQKFLQSGYTGQQAINDGWLTGTGKPGWQNTAGYQAPLNPQGMTGAPYAQQQIRQAQQPMAQNASTYGGSQAMYGSGGGGGLYGSGGGGGGLGGGMYGSQVAPASQNASSYGGAAASGGISYGASQSPYGGSMAPISQNASPYGGAASGQSLYGSSSQSPYGGSTAAGQNASSYGNAPQRGGIYQQLNSMLGGSGQGQYGASQSPYGGSMAAPQRMQGSPGTPPGGYGQRQNTFGQSPAWQNFLGNLNKPGGA